MKKFISAFLLMAAMAFSVSTFVSCNDLTEEMEKVTTTANENAKAIEELEGKVTALTSRLEQAEKDVVAAQAAADAAQDAADAAQDAADAAQDDADQALKDAKDAADAALAAAEAAKQALIDAKAYADGILVDAKKYTDAEIKKASDTIQGLLDALEGKVDSNTSRIAALELQAQALVNYLGIKTDAEGNITESAKINEIIKKIDDLKTDLMVLINKNKDDITAINNRLNDKETGLDAIWAEIAKINESLVTLKGIVNSILKSMVFVPDAYVDGVEADKYVYADGNYQTAETKNADESFKVITADGKTVTYTVTKKQPWLWNDGDKYAIPSVQEMLFHLNPAKADLTGASWEFLNASPEKIETKAAKVAKVVKTDSTPALNEDDLLAVKYKVQNPDALNPEGEISVAALQATFVEEEKETAVITSDYATIYPETITFEALAYNTITTEEDENCEEETHLYDTAVEVLENAPTVKVVYNVGKEKTDLKSMLNIHYTDIDGEIKEMSFDKAFELYGLTVEFLPFEYKSGTNNTEENKYLFVNTTSGKVTPCYVNASKQPIEIVEGSTEATGRSAIGREPAVLVKLKDGDNIVLAGYIKLQITDVPPVVVTPEVEVIEIDKTTPIWAYICDSQVKNITWDDMSGQILEELKMTKDEFVANYEIYAEKTDVKTYLLTDEVDKNENPVFEEVTGYGTISEITDDDVALTNDILMYTVGGTEMLDKILDEANANREFTLYARYKSVVEDHQPADVYVGFKVKIAELPAVIAWANKADAAWYPKNVDLAQRTTVRANVPQPTIAGITSNDVLNYKKNIDEYFWRYIDETAETTEPGLTLTPNDYNPIYDSADIKSEIDALRYEYVFAMENDGEIIDDPTTTVVEELSVLAADQKTLLWNGSAIATIDNNGNLVYDKENADAKRFLNLFAHDDAQYQQYAIIEIVAYYGDECDIKIPVADPYFKVRFLRPIDIIKNPAAKLVDATAEGATVSLGSFFTIQDWRDKAVMVYAYNEVAEVWEATTPEDEGVNLFEYYKIDAVKIHLDEAESNFNLGGDKYQPINLKVIRLDVEGAGNADPDGNYTVDLSAGVKALNEAMLTYDNNEGNVGNFIIRIPVTVSYAWGNIKVVVPVPVEHTMANN